jgi:hypothetical protein
LSAAKATSVATRDQRSYLERAIAHGIEQGILNDSHLARMQEEGAKALVQIANYFGSAYLRANLETALARFSNLASLYLEDRFGDDLQGAARSLRHNTLLSHSRGGSEMLKQLHALPEFADFLHEAPTAESQRQFLDHYSLNSPMTVAMYQRNRDARIENRHQIDFARWLGKKLGVNASALSEFTEADAVIYSGILVCYAEKDPLRLPTRSSMAKLIAVLRKNTFKPRLDTWDHLMREAPLDYQRIGEAKRKLFVEQLLPLLQSPECSAQKIIAGQIGPFFIDENIEKDLAEYERSVAAEWFKVMRGKSDPDSLATVFLTIAARMPPKRALLKREAKELIAAIRENGFDSESVVRFIETDAPIDTRDELLHMWQEELLPEARDELVDPMQDDTQMERALNYLRERCIAKWKSAR